MQARTANGGDALFGSVTAVLGGANAVGASGSQHVLNTNITSVSPGATVAITPMPSLMYTMGSIESDAERSRLRDRSSASARRRAADAAAADDDARRRRPQQLGHIPRELLEVSDEAEDEAEQEEAQRTQQYFNIL